MKISKIMNVLFAGAMAIAAAACADEQPSGNNGPGGYGYSAGAGARARELGIDSYEVHQDGTVSRIQLLDIDGASLGVLTVEATAALQSASFASAKSANVVALRASSAGYAIGVNGEDRVRLTSDKDGKIENATPAADLSDVASELALLNATMDDGVQINANGTTAYVIPDCPWWVSLAACAGCATVGAFVAPCLACGACIGSYLV